MKQKVTHLCLVLSLAFILLAFRVDEALMHFILMGEIPGTGLSLSPEGMYTLIALALASPLLYSLYRRKASELGRQLELAKARLPKRRYTSPS